MMAAKRRESMPRMSLLTLFLLYPTLVGALNLPSRRDVIQGTLVAGIGGTIVSQPEPASAAKGAAEYDLEYYMRDLLGGNAKEGNILPSKGPPVSPPRTLQGPLLPLLLNDDCSPDCIPTQALLKQIGSRGSSQAIMEKVQDFRTKTSKSFAIKAPWKEPHVTDQYYFDLTSYALWRTAATEIPNFVDRDVFARNVGRGILAQLIEQKLVPPLSKSDLLSNTVPAMVAILKLFQESNYCKSYRIGDGTASSNSAVFDELDNEDISNGASVNCLVSIYEPATLGASLQITGESSRFGPEYVGSTLAALWEQIGLRVSYETFFVDNEYRPNPKDYFPNEQLLQFTLQK